MVGRVDYKAVPWIVEWFDMTSLPIVEFVDHEHLGMDGRTLENIIYRFATELEAYEFVLGDIDHNIENIRAMRRQATKEIKRLKRKKIMYKAILLM